MPTFNTDAFFTSLLAFDYLAEAKWQAMEYLEGYAEEEEAQEAFFRFLWFVEDTPSISE